MLTRLKVSGFKNLVDVDVHLGPFTCIAGANATGKSNLFDAILFLSYLASDTLLNAGLSVRSEAGRTADVRNLFQWVGGRHTQEMSFEAEMIVPEKGVDDLGQEAKASITFLRYKLRLGYRTDESLPSLGSLELIHEELTHINVTDAHKHLHFPHKVAWRKSVITGRRVGEFISTAEKDGKRLIKLHQEGTQGRPREYLAVNLPRTVLSSVNAAESPTALLAKRELQSWRLLQLEPSALREPDKFTDSPGLGVDGSHIPATLDYLARSTKNGDRLAGLASKHAVFDQLATRLSDLIDNVREIRLDRDEQRQLLTLELMDHTGTSLPARSLSDGTLRFIALAVLALDPTEVGLICLEEPENGIHPARVEPMLRLLQDIAVDTEDPIGVDNPLRQLVINTHSPSVVVQVPDDSLLISELREAVVHNQRMKAAAFRWLPDTWRCEADPLTPTVVRGRLLAYLNPTPISTNDNMMHESHKYRRLVDRSDLQPYLPGVAEAT